MKFEMCISQDQKDLLIRALKTTLMQIDLEIEPVSTFVEMDALRDMLDAMQPDCLNDFTS